MRRHADHRSPARGTRIPVLFYLSETARRSTARSRILRRCNASPGISSPNVTLSRVRVSCKNIPRVTRCSAAPLLYRFAPRTVLRIPVNGRLRTAKLFETPAGGENNGPYYVRCCNSANGYSDGGRSFYRAANFHGVVRRFARGTFGDTQPHNSIANGGGSSESGSGREYETRGNLITLWKKELTSPGGARCPELK